ncbi:unnamed protein product [Brassica oleracea var. botrytis]
MFDQSQKHIGLPMSDEIEKQDTMKKCMTRHPLMNFSNTKILARIDQSMLAAYSFRALGQCSFLKPKRL